MSAPLRKKHRSALEIDPGSLLSATLDATADGVLIVDRSQRIVLFNEKFLRMWGIPGEFFVDRDTPELISLVKKNLKRPDEFARRIDELNEHPEVESHDLIELLDGRTFERFSLPLRMGHRTLGRVLTFRDISGPREAEAKLRQSEERYRLIIETAEEGVWGINAAGGTQLVNSRLLEMLGYESEEMIGRTIYEFLDEENKKVALRALELRAHGNRGNYDLEIFRKDGRKIWVRISASPLMDSQGRYLGSFALVTDITERKAMEEELRSSRNRLEELVLERTSFIASILENIPDMIFVKDARDLKFVQFNKAGETLLGFSRSELVGKSDYDFFPKDEADFFTRKDRDVLRSKQVLDVAEEVIHTRNQGVRTLHTKKIPILDPEGNPKYLLGISEDITLHKLIDVEKRARLEAENARRRADFLADISRTLAGLLDPKTTLAALARHLVPELADWCLLTMGEGESRLSAAAHGETDKQVLVEELLSFLPDPESSEGTPRVLRTRKSVTYSDINEQLLQSSTLNSPFGTRNEASLSLIRKLGARSLMAVPMMARDKIIGVMMLVSARDPRRYGTQELEMAKDIAGRAALAIDNAILYQETRAAVRVREDFISIASHELRTPLTPLTAQLQLIERMVSKGNVELGPESEIVRLIRMSRRDIGRLSQLVENLLDISRIGAGKLELQREELNLTALLRSVVERLEPECRRFRCTMELRADEDIIGYLDGLRLEQVFTNLLMNAVKFGAGHPITVTLVKPRADLAVIRFRDKGVGISKEDLKRIFERFERAVSERQFGGLGLGLYIAREIVQAHGGTIRVESEPGQGSTFLVELPLGASPQ